MLAQRLNDATSDFYRRQSSSFSETRQSPWGGWSDVAERVAPVCAPRMSVLDLGCGNLRFERFLGDRVGGNFTVYAVDNCAELVSCGTGAARPSAARHGATWHDTAQYGKNRNGSPETDPSQNGTQALTRSNAHGQPRIHVRNVDIAQTLIGEANLTEVIDAPPCDLAVAFGIMHHIPLPAHRQSALDALVGNVRPGGFVAVSFWQFLNSPKLASKAAETTARGCEALGINPADLGRNDYLLGWQHDEGTFRFCHHFDEAEIDCLAESVADRAVEVARFSADGKTGNLNRYLILRKL